MANTNTNTNTNTNANTRPGVLVTNPKSRLMLPALEERFRVLCLWETLDVPSFLALHAPSIRALVSVSACPSLIDALPNLQIISCPSAGIDKIDLAKCRSRSIAITHNPDIPTDDTADLALLLMLAALRRLCPADRYLRLGLWPQQGDFMITRKASGRRVGIVGLGRIGLAIARRVEAFGCTISYQGRSLKPSIPYVYYSNVVDLAANSDVLFVSCALTRETRHMIGRKVLDALGPEGTLVNIARGLIVDEAELVTALVEGRLGAAGLDVFEDEPNVPAELLTMDNVVLTPHLGSGTWETRRAAINLVVMNLDAYFSGKPLLTPVN